MKKTKPKTKTLRIITEMDNTNAPITIVELTYEGNKIVKRETIRRMKFD